MIVSALSDEINQTPISTGRPRLFVWLAPGLLVAVAALQITAVSLSQLTPWKGGGFGMFSTVDSADARYVKVYVRTATGEWGGLWPPSEAEAIRRLQGAPTASELERLASRLSRSVWVDADAGPGPASPHPGFSRRGVRALGLDEPAADPQRVVEAIEVRAEVWKVRYVPPEDKLLAEKVLTATAAVPFGTPHDQAP
jgi:hypothetical protein